MHEKLGIFEGVLIEGLDSPIKNTNAKHYSSLPQKEIQRILKQGLAKIKKDYKLEARQFMIKDYKTKTKLMLFLRRENDNGGVLGGFIYAYYNIDYCPYYEDTFDLFELTDKEKVIEKKLKQASEKGFYIYYDYDDSFFRDSFEYGILYRSYMTVNLNKRKYK